MKVRHEAFVEIPYDSIAAIFTSTKTAIDEGHIPGNARIGEMKMMNNPNIAHKMMRVITFKWETDE